jgi:hypothetical protein
MAGSLAASVANLPADVNPTSSPFHHLLDNRPEETILLLEAPFILSQDPSDELQEAEFREPLTVAVLWHPVCVYVKAY